MNSLRKSPREEPTDDYTRLMGVMARKSVNRQLSEIKEESSSKYGSSLNISRVQDQ